jgi:hypothetical protein
MPRSVKSLDLPAITADVVIVACRSERAAPLGVVDPPDIPASVQLPLLN